jgi:CheY-like chemotaxis protein
LSERILVVCDDLFFWARIRDAAKSRGREAIRVGDEEAMEQAWREGGVGTILADLGARSVDLTAWAARWKTLHDGPRLVAFGSHVDVDSLERARRDGFDPVLPRSKFVATLADWI